MRQRKRVSRWHQGRVHLQRASRSHRLGRRPCPRIPSASARCESSPTSSKEAGRCRSRRVRKKPANETSPSLHQAFGGGCVGSSSAAALRRRMLRVRRRRSPLADRRVSSRRRRRRRPRLALGASPWRWRRWSPLADRGASSRRRRGRPRERSPLADLAAASATGSAAVASLGSSSGDCVGSRLTTTGRLISLWVSAPLPPLSSLIAFRHGVAHSRRSHLP